MGAPDSRLTRQLASGDAASKAAYSGPVSALRRNAASAIASPAVAAFSLPAHAIGADDGAATLPGANGIEHAADKAPPQPHTNTQRVPCIRSKLRVPAHQTAFHLQEFAKARKTAECFLDRVCIHVDRLHIKGFS